MNLVCFLKILCDLCYFGTFACFFAGSFGLTGSLIPQFCLVALVCALSRLLEDHFPAKPRLRFLPLPLLPLVLLLPAQTAGRILLLPAILYVVWTAWRSAYDVDYFQAVDTFRLELKILPIPAVFALIAQQGSRLERFSAPYLLVFLLCSVLLLRMVRHDEDTLSQPRFRLMNGLSLAAVLAVCGLVGSPAFRGLLLWLAKALWRLVSWPLLAVTVAVGGGLAWIIDVLLPDDLLAERAQELELLFEELEQGKEDSVIEQATELAEQNPWLEYVLIALGILIAIIVTVLLFRWLAARRRPRTTGDGHQTRTAADPLAPPERPLTRLTARTPAQKVRYWYQQLLRKTYEEGGNFKPSMTTRHQKDVEQETLPGNDEAIARLRELYLPARYADRADEDAAREAKSLYQQIKK